MADGGVKNRMKIFQQMEQNATETVPPLKKPQVTNKNKPWVKPGVSPTSNGVDKPEPAKKPDNSSTQQEDGADTNSIKAKTAALNNALKPRDLKNDSNNNKSSPVERNKSSAGDGNSPKPIPPSKFSKPGAGANEDSGKPPTLPKSSVPGSKSTCDRPNLPPKVAILPKFEPKNTELKKTDSSSSADSSASSGQSVTSNSKDSTDSQPKNFGFENRRPVAVNGVPVGKKFPLRGSDTSPQSSTSSKDSPSPPPLPKSTPPIPTSHSKKNSHDDEPTSPSPISKPSVNLGKLKSELRSSKKETSWKVKVEEAETDIEIVQRQSDGKKFRKITFLDASIPAIAPETQRLTCDVDLSSLRTEFENAVSKLERKVDDTPKETVVEEEEDPELIYDDGESELPLRPPKPPAKTKRDSGRISMIPDISAEEEGAYDDPPPDELYTCAESETLAESKETNKSDLKADQEKKKKAKEAEAKKKEEKERLKKEKQQKKKESDEMKLRKKFGMTGDEYVGEGTIKSDAKGGGLNLKVRKDQTATILRIDNNPPNKWLVKTDMGLGFVDSGNISVDPNIIKQKKPRSMTFKEALLNPLTAGKNLIEAMTNNRKESTFEDDDQPVYDAVPDDTGVSGTSPAIEEFEYEEVYEECP